MAPQVISVSLLVSPLHASKQGGWQLSSSGILIHQQSTSITYPTV